MSIRVHINVERLARLVGRPVVERVAGAKREQLLRASKFNFRDDTGALRKTIRIEGDDIVAIGDRDHPYWQHVLRFKRGDGTVWVRKALLQDNYRALQNARNAVRGR